MVEQPTGIPSTRFFVRGKVGISSAVIENKSLGLEIQHV